MTQALKRATNLAPLALPTVARWRYIPALLILAKFGSKVNGIIADLSQHFTTNVVTVSL